MNIDLSTYDRTKRHLVGVSGGRDSVALLHLLLDAGFQRLIVCHLDHQLRGRSSRADAAFVAKLAARHGLDIVSGKADVRSIAKKEGLSIETAAREARYDFFAKVAREKRCRTLFLAHHADDQVETFLFNLFRGAGPAGLGAMRPESSRQIGRAKLLIIRPLLATWRSEIDDYVAAHRLAFREDASNASTAPTRNKMRHEIIPALGKWFGRDIRRSIWRTAEILGAEHDWLDSLTPAPGHELIVAALREMPAAQQRRTIHAWLKLTGVGNISFNEVEAVRSLLPPDSKPAKINLPGNLHARRRANRIFLEKGT